MRALALIVALISATPAFATQDGWPALYDVAGVAADDVLNIRAEPDAGAAIIGTLAPDAANVEVIRATDDLRWGLVNTAERSGWVSLGFMARQGGQWDGRMPGIRQCFGNEPFWSLSQDGARVRFSTPDEPPIDGLVSGRYASLSHRGRFAYSGNLLSADAGPLEFILSLRTEACNDGMSDRSYGIGADLLIRDRDTSDGFRKHGLISGCCSIAP